MRGFIPVLSEAYSNDDLPTRVAVTSEFVHEILSLTAAEREAVRAAVTASRGAAGDSVAVRSRLAPPVVREVVAERTESAGEGAGGYARRLRTGVFRPIRMPVYHRFEAERREVRPAAYLLPAELAGVADLLRRQGIAVRRLDEEWSGPLERFTVDSVVTGPALEGHRPARVEGRWGPASPGAAGTGWFVADTDQPLGVLACYLLEPASEDGVVTWNLVAPSAGATFPILRSRSPVRAAAHALP
jgi:dipeptidyl-peptidase-4